MDEKSCLVDRKAHFEASYWSRLVVILLGLWLLAAPFTLGYEAGIAPSPTGIGLKDPHAIQRACHLLMVSDLLAGVVVLILGVLSLRFGRNWSSWLVAVVGIFLQFAPLLFWSPLPAAYVNDTLIGMLLVVFSVLVTKLPYEGDSSAKVVPAGWSYNPSSWLQRLPVIFFGFLGWFISRYLSAYQLGYLPTVFDPFFGNGTYEVITSSLSRSFPLSDAGLGAIAYGLEALMGCKGGAGRWRTMPWMVLLFGILVVPLGLVSILLVMSQPIIVGFWCGLCLVTAGGMLMMLALTVDEVLAVCQFLKGRNRPFLELFFQGGEQAGAQEDKRTPSFLATSGRFKAMIYGVRAPWNLGLAALVGVWVLFSPAFLSIEGKAADNIHIFGALMVVFSVISFAEVARSLRLLNILVALWLILSIWLLDGYHHYGALNTLICACIFGLLSFRKGAINEQYGSWKII